MHTRGRQLAAGLVGLLGTLALAGNAGAQTPAERPRMPMPKGPRVVSPEEGADRRVTFRGHTWANWRDYLAEFAPQLFR